VVARSVRRTATRVRVGAAALLEHNPEGKMMMRHVFVAFLVAGLVSSAAYAQDAMPEGWSVGPVVGRLGEMATVSVPGGYMFLDAKATKKFLEDGQNIPAGDELGAIFRPAGDTDSWFAVFSYEDTGHVDDSEKDSIDADALMKSLKEGNRLGNEERRKRGWEILQLEGWHQKPFYDLTTNNLTWSTVVSSEGDSSKAINHSVRLLGRTGTMSVQLVADAATVGSATVDFDGVLRGYAYNPGRRYAEFQKGDKLAGYGLTALIAGGVGAAAVKTGILQKIWKVLVFAIVAVGAALKKLFASVFGKREKTITEQYMSGPTGN
jgi:uncharacterized membrane-anchored protein